MTLSDPLGNLLDVLYVPRLQADYTYGRNFDGNGLYYYDLPTPGAANGYGFIGYAETPTIVLPAGRYDGDQVIEITAPASA